MSAAKLTFYVKFRKDGAVVHEADSLAAFEVLVRQWPAESMLWVDLWDDAINWPACSAVGTVDEVMAAMRVAVAALEDCS